MKMQAFHTWFLLSRPMTLGVRALAFDGEGRVLLVKHTYIAGWHLPGGGVEHGQTVQSALERELLEEANAFLGDPPQLLSVHHNTRVTRRDHVVLYLCRNVGQEAQKERDMEIVAAQFFEPDNLPEGTTEPTHRRLAEYLGRSEPDPYW